MLVKTIFAGFGGQGVLSMGLNLAQAAMLEGKNITFLPSYGAEVRGDTAHYTVAISDEEIASLVASSPELVVVMNKPSLVKFQNQIQSGGLFFINSSLIEVEPTSCQDSDYSPLLNYRGFIIVSGSQVSIGGNIMHRTRTISMSTTKGKADR